MTVNAQTELEPCPYEIDGCVLENEEIGPCLCVNPVSRLKPQCAAEPVAWRFRAANGEWVLVPWVPAVEHEPLYTAPPQTAPIPSEPTKEMALAGRKALAIVADRMEEAKLLATSSIDFWQRVGHEPANEIYKAMIEAVPRPESKDPMSKLLPCPFCGMPPRLREIDGARPLYIISCKEEACAINPRVSDTVKEDVVASWNTRDTALTSHERKNP